MKKIKYNLSPFLICLVFTLLVQSDLYAQFPAWGAIGSGVNGVVKDIIEFNNDLIVAGSFTTPGKNIAKYNGSRWDSLGTGTNDTVFALLKFNNNLIAVGAFTTAGGVTCNRIAQWNGAVWSPLGLGTNGTIFAVDSANGFLVIGGRFTTAGGVNCNHLAKWQGTSWSAMGTGVNDNVFAFEQFGSDLIIGGAFTLAGTDTALRIVSFNFDSASYAPLGTGIDSGSVYALRGFLNSVYVGGDFTKIGGVTVNRFAEWTGTNWNVIGTGINGTVRTLDSLGPFFLGIGGSFSNANGTSANNIVAFGGSSSFSPFGGGLSGGTGPSVNSITGWRAVTVAGGLFTSPGANIARWGLLPVAPELILPLDGATGTSVTPLFTWAQFAGMYAFRIHVARDPNFLNMTIADSNLLIPQYQVTGANPLLNLTTYFWRVNASNGFGNGPFSLIRFFTTGMIGVLNQNEIPDKFMLYQNFPNPFNPVTKVRFDLPQLRANSKLKLLIYDVNGKQISELINTEYVAGKWEVSFDASNFASGIYFYRIEAGKFAESRKMVLVK